MVAFMAKNYGRKRCIKAALIAAFHVCTKSESHCSNRNYLFVSMGIFLPFDFRKPLVCNRWWIKGRRRKMKRTFVLIFFQIKHDFIELQFPSRLFSTPFYFAMREEFLGIGNPKRLFFLPPSSSFWKKFFSEEETFQVYASYDNLESCWSGVQYLVYVNKAPGKISRAKRRKRDRASIILSALNWSDFVFFSAKIFLFSVIQFS